MQKIAIRTVLLAVVLTIILAASNTYLALKIGFLTSASIPAAILSMGILRFFKNATIFENNLIQTAASAGEAVAGGIAFTVPALIIIHYWTSFSFWENFFIALSSGVLGIVFSIPLRKILVSNKDLPFPEGKAIAEVLQTSGNQKIKFNEMIYGGLVGGLLDFAQSGLKVIANTFQCWFASGSTIFGFGGGFSVSLIGAGYLMGFQCGLSLLLGAVVVWGIGIPIMSTLYGTPIYNELTLQSALQTYGNKVHYIGIGAMLMAGLWTFITLIKPVFASIYSSFVLFNKQQMRKSIHIPHTEHDLPFSFILLGMFAAFIILFFLFQNIFHLDLLPIPSAITIPFILSTLIYILVLGFILVVICSYFSGLVGVSASPGSSVIIASIIFAAILLRTFFHFFSEALSSTDLTNIAAIAILISSIITGAACIANDNTQDLKVGHLIGATPWQQQLMLLLGVVIASIVIPPIMNLLFNAYGIANVFPHPGMNPLQTLAAPPAAMMAGIAQSVFNHDLPWAMLAVGGCLIGICIVLNPLFKRFGIRLSILSVAIGIYLPLSASIPLCMGAFISLLTNRMLNKQMLSSTSSVQKEEIELSRQRGILLACGLVTGAALVDVLMAIPMSISGSADILQLFPSTTSFLTKLAGFSTVIGIGSWFIFNSRKNTIPYKKS